MHTVIASSLALSQATGKPSKIAVYQPQTLASVSSTIYNKLVFMLVRVVMALGVVKCSLWPQVACAMWKLAKKVQINTAAIVDRYLDPTRHFPRLGRLGLE